MTPKQAAKALAAKRPAKWVPFNSLAEIAAQSFQLLSPRWRKDRNRRKTARKVLGQ